MTKEQFVNEFYTAFETGELKRIPTLISYFASLTHEERVDHWDACSQHAIEKTGSGKEWWEFFHSYIGFEIARAVGWEP